MTCFRYSHCHLCLHWIISHTSFFCFWDNFFYSVLVSTNLCICECQIVKGDHTTSIVSLSLKNSSVSIFQLETEFTIFKSTTCKSFAEVETSLNWCYCKVVEFCICRHCNSSTQETCSGIFSNFNFHFCVHSIVIDICIVTSFFTHSVSVFTYSVVFNRIKCDRSISFVFLSLDYITIFNQFKGEGIIFKRFSFQFLRELELSFRSSRCKGIVKLCIYTCRCISICIHTIC